MISCIIAVMNREEALEKMLPTWTKIEKIKDFVIVDWSSQKPIINNVIVQDQIKRYKNIKIIRVDNQKYFYRCLAWNLGFQNTNYENQILLKLDVDYLNLDDGWIDCLKIAGNRKCLDNYFITGSSQFYPYSLGFLLVNKKDFGEGYNENLESVWGFEDIDLIERIKTKSLSSQKIQSYEDNGKGCKDWIGLERIIFFNISKYIYHIPHSNEERVKNLKYSEKILKNGFSEGEKWKLAKKNKLLSKYFSEWSPAKYEIIEEDAFYKRLKLITALPQTEK
jgi:hypothetical protein